MKKILLSLLFVSINLVYSQSDGNIDTSFDSSNGIDETIYDLETLSNGSIIVVGKFNNFDSNSTNSIAKLNTNGTLDLNFTTNIGTGANYIIYTVASQSDGKLIIGGAFTSFNNQSHSGILRLNQDGTIDTSFNVGSGANGSIYDIKILNDNSILIGGTFNDFNGTPFGGIVKLMNNGSIDSSFNFNQSGSTINISTTSTGEIILNRNDRVLKLNSNGQVDNTFNTVTGLNIQSLLVLKNDKIIIGGYFTQYDGTPINRIAKLNIDGTLDSSFNVGTGFDYGVLNIQEQPDNKLIVSGNFSNYNGIARNYLLRLNIDGTIDSNFIQTNNGFDDDVLGTKLIDNSGMYAFGKFTSYGGTSNLRIARLLNNYQSLNIEDFNDNKYFIIFPNPVINTLNIKSNETIEELSIYNLNGVLIKKQYNSNSISIKELPAGIYVVSIKVNSIYKQIKVIKN